MRANRKKRIWIIIYILVGASLSIAAVLMALQENLNHFFSPADIQAGKAVGIRSLRVGGMVREGSVVRELDSVKVEFVITDYAADLRVQYEGILPDLFREGQGIVAIGTLIENQVFKASQVLAKHDENYMPEEAKRALEASGHAPNYQ